jgi:ParB/RepB/Spo0J family partition protein
VSTATAQQEMNLQPLPPRPTSRIPEGKYEELPLKVIKARKQVREHFDEEKMRLLADSVHENGVVEPIVVRWSADDRAYLIIAGERRYRAAEMVGLAKIPAMVRYDVNDDDAETLQIVENLVRENLTAAERVRGIGKLVDRLGVREVSRRLSMDIGTVSRTAGVRTLWAPARKLIDDGKCDSPDIAHELARLASLDEEAAMGLVEAFYNPRAWNPAAPTRAEIRGAIEIKHKAAEAARTEAERTAQQQIDLDNRKGYESQAGDPPVSQAQPAAALKSDEPAAPPAGSAAAKAATERVQQASSDRIALVKAAGEIAARLEHDALSALGIISRPSPRDGEYPVCSIFGREISQDLHTNDQPVLVSVDNYGLTPLPGEARSVQEVCYSLFLELPRMTELELRQVIAGWGQSVPAEELQVSTHSPADRQDWLVRQFLEEAFEPSDGSSVKSGWLHEQLLTWFGAECMSIQHMGAAMDRLGYEKKRTKHGWHYQNVKPKAEAAK